MADETPPLDEARLAELEARDVITLALHACGLAHAQLAAYNDGIPDGPITYRVHCHGCRIQTFPFETPQEAYAAWHKHLTLTGANEVDRLRTREAAATEIVRDVATEDTLAYEGDAGDDYRCVFCGGHFDWGDGEQHSIPTREQLSDVPRALVHTPDCPVTKARALLSEGE